MFYKQLRTEMEVQDTGITEFHLTSDISAVIQRKWGCLPADQRLAFVERARQEKKWETDLLAKGQCTFLKSYFIL